MLEFATIFFKIILMQGDVTASAVIRAVRAQRCLGTGRRPRRGAEMTSPGPSFVLYFDKYFRINVLFFFFI